METPNVNSIVLPAEPAETRSFWHATAPHPQIQTEPLPTSIDHVVIGGGWLGLSTTYWLARSGAKVALLEARNIAAGASGRNGGFMLESLSINYLDAIKLYGHQNAQAIWKLTADNRQLFRQVLAEEQIECHYREHGSVDLACGEEQDQHMRQTIAQLQADGFNIDLIEREAIQALIGTPLGPQIRSAMFIPENGLLHSARLAQGMLAAAQRHGAKIYQNTPVLSLEADNDGVRINLAQGGQIRARRVVVALNAWLDQLIPQLKGVVVPTRGQVLAYEPAPQLFRCAMGANITPTAEYWQQTLDGSIVLGGCRAVAENADSDIRTMTTTDDVQQALERVLPELFPALDDPAAPLKVSRRWAGLMAFTPDHLAIVDRVPGIPAASFVGGFSGHGMSFGQPLGHALAQAHTTDTWPEELKLFAWDRPSLAQKH